MIQMDIFGDTIRTTVWRPGTPQPAAQSVVSDPAFGSGTVGLVFNENTDFSSGTFRFAKASDIPLVDGDMDGDRDIDFDDIDDFVLGLNDPAAYAAMFGVPPLMRGDTDNDGDNDFDDIGLFVTTILTSGNAASPEAIPEPHSWVLALLGVAGLLSRVRRTR
jgi:MYXO-CTERM domain-containing protein